MQQAKAIAKYIRVSPLKARRVADLIRGKSLTDAVVICTLTNNKPSRAFKKVLLSAAANAENNLSLSQDSLFVKEVAANQGPTLKRMKARSHGRGTVILKRSSHLSVTLEQKA